MEASATITNTIAVVIMVSRRVGQVTLAVSERTSCKNLNGLVAIVSDPHPSSDELKLLISGIRTDLSRPALFRRLSRHAGSIVREFQSRVGYPRLTGRQQVAAIYCGRSRRSRVPGRLSW